MPSVRSFSPDSSPPASATRTSRSMSLPHLSGEALSGFRMLPTEVVVLIFSYLPIRSFVVVSTVCRRWRRIAISPNMYKHISVAATPKLCQAGLQYLLAGYPFAESLYIECVGSRNEDMRRHDLAASQFQGHPRLKHIYVESAAITKGASMCPMLQSLCCWYNPGPEDDDHLMAVMRQCLDLRSLRITVVDVEGFTPWTACAPNLASLSLHFCTSSMVALLVPWFAAHPLLTQLELHFNDSLGQVAVPPHLFDSTAALRRLVLSGACMGWKDVTALSKSLPKLEQLTLKTSSVQLSSAFKHEANGLVGGLILALRILAPSTALASIELVDVSIQPVDDYIPTWLHLQDQGDIEFPGLTKVKVDEGERQILEQEDFSFLSTRLPSLQTLSLALSHLRLPGSIFSSDVLLDMIENLSKYADLISLTLQNFATTGLKCRPQLESPTAGRTQSLCGRMKELRLNLFPSIPASLLRLLLFGDKWSSLTSLILLGTDWDNNADELPPVEFPHLKSLQLLEKPLHGHCLLRHIAKSARNLRVLSVLTPGLFPTQTMAALASDTPNITYFTLDQGILEVDAFEMLSRQWKGLKHVHIEGAGLEILGKKPWLQGLLPFLETHRFLMSLVVTADLYPVCAERLIALAQLEASRQTILERTGRLGETGQEIAPIYKDGRVQVCPRSPNQKQRRDRCVPDGDDSDSSMLDEVGFEDCSMAVDHNPGIGSDSPVVDVEMHDSATTDQRQHPSPSKDGSLNEGQRDNADPMAMVSRDGRLGSAAGRADREATEPEEPEETARRLRSYLRTRFPWIECLDVRKRRPTQSQIYGLPAFESGLVRR